MASFATWVCFKHGPAKGEKTLIRNPGPIVWVAPSPMGYDWVEVPNGSYPGAFPYKDSGLPLAKQFNSGGDVLVYVPAAKYKVQRPRLVALKKRLKRS